MGLFAPSLPAPDGTLALPSVAFASEASLGFYRSAAGIVGLSGNLTIQATSSTTGIIYKGVNRFIHDFALAGTTGQNTFVGVNAGNLSMTGRTGTLGSYLTAMGVDALQSNTTGGSNSAMGVGALQYNTTGNYNSAMGVSALQSNTAGHYNSAMGVNALQSNTTGVYNSAMGVQSLYYNTTGNYNSAMGASALQNNTTGSSNSAMGLYALLYNTTGNYNSAMGVGAGYNPLSDIPQYRITTDTNMTLIGYGATKNNVAQLTNGTAIGSGAFVLASNQVVLGNDSVTTTLLKGSVGIGLVSPLAALHLLAGTAAANTAPLKFTSGVNLTAAEAGVHEYNGNHYLTNAAVRFPIGGTLFDHYADVGNTTTVETDLYSDTLAANTFNVNGDKVESRYAGIFVANATATRQLKVYFAGTVIFDSGALTISAGADAWDVHVMIVRESATVVRCSVAMTTTGATTSAYAQYTRITTLTLSGTNILKITGTAAGSGAATNDIVAKLGSVEFAPAA